MVATCICIAQPGTLDASRVLGEKLQITSFEKCLCRSKNQNYLCVNSKHGCFNTPFSESIVSLDVKFRDSYIFKQFYSMFKSFIYFIHILCRICFHFVCTSFGNRYTYMWHLLDYLSGCNESSVIFLVISYLKNGQNLIFFFLESQIYCILYTIVWCSNKHSCIISIPGIFSPAKCRKGQGLKHFYFISKPLNFSFPDWNTFLLTTLRLQYIRSCSFPLFASLRYWYDRTLRNLCCTCSGTQYK